MYPEIYEYSLKSSHSLATKDNQTSTINQVLSSGTRRHTSGKRIQVSWAQHISCSFSLSSAFAMIWKYFWVISFQTENLKQIPIRLHPSLHAKLLQLCLILCNPMGVLILLHHSSQWLCGQNWVKILTSHSQLFPLFGLNKQCYV